MQNRQFVFVPKIQYKLVAERSEANLSNLRIPFWCQRQESNLRPSAYETLALPLSYAGLQRFFSIKKHF